MDIKPSKKENGINIIDCPQAIAKELLTDCLCTLNALPSNDIHKEKTIQKIKLFLQQNK